MADDTPQSTKTPKHLWIISVLALLWNSVGALDFFMTQTKNEAYMKAFTPEQLDYFYGFPLWVVIAWGIATWGSLIGSVLLLFRKALAFHLFVASFVSMGLTFLHNYLLTDGLKVMGGGVGPVIFSAAIMVIGVLLLVYARAMRRRGVLR